VVLNCPAVVVVAAPDASFGSPDDAGKLQAFLLQPLDAFVLHRATWHWGPFPVSQPRVEMLNVQGLRYAEDNDCCDLGSLGASAEVLLTRD
jgi:ureidoglycolate hydrolase